MDRMRRIAGIGKAKVPSAVQKDKDKSIVFFRELYKRDKDRDVNLLEPMYSVDFDTIQGGFPSGKRDFFIPVDEKHDYDWVRTIPSTPLFPSLEMEANSSEMLSGKPEATKTSVKLASPTADPSSKKDFFRGAPAIISKEKSQPYTIDKRPTYTALKKHCDRCYSSQGSITSAVKRVTNPQVPYKAPKNLLAAGSIFARHATLTAKAQSRDPALRIDAKLESGSTRRQSCPPAATRGIKELQLDGKQNVLPAKGEAVTGSEPASSNCGHAGEATWMKGMRRADGRKEQRQKF